MPCLVWLPDPDGNAFWGEPAPTCVGGALGASLLDGAMVLTAGVLIIFLGSSMSDLARRARTASGSRPCALSRR